MRLPPRGVVRFLGWHVLKLEFWHFGPWTKNLGFCFRIGICGIFYKKKPAFGTLHCPTTCSLHPFASCFSVFSVSVAFPSFFAVFGPSLDFLHMPASTCSSLSFLCAVIFLNLLVLFGGAVRSWEVWEVFFLFVFFIFLCCLVVWCGAVVGGGVGGGLMTSMRMRLVFSFCFLHLLVPFGGAVRSWGGGGWGGWEIKNRGLLADKTKQKPLPLNLKPNPAPRTSNLMLAACLTSMPLVSCTADAESDVAAVAHAVVVI